MIYRARSGETPLDDLSGLKIKIPNITRGQLDQAEEQGIQKAVAKYKRRRVRSFDIGLFNRLHRDMFAPVWRWAGQHRTHQTNIGSPPQRILQDLIILQQDLAVWPAVLESGVRLHHRAVQIHPFAGGNGRWSRLLADIWLREMTGIHVVWPVGLAQESPIRAGYLKALRAADRMDLQPLLRLYETMVKAG